MLLGRKNSCGMDPGVRSPITQNTKDRSVQADRVLPADSSKQRCGDACIAAPTGDLIESYVGVTHVGNGRPDPRPESAQTGVGSPAKSPALLRDTLCVHLQCQTSVDHAHPGSILHVPHQGRGPNGYRPGILRTRKDTDVQTPGCTAKISVVTAERVCPSSCFGSARSTQRGWLDTSSSGKHPRLCIRRFSIRITKKL